MVTNVICSYFIYLGIPSNMSNKLSTAPYYSKPSLFLPTMDRSFLLKSENDNSLAGY